LGIPVVLFAVTLTFELLGKSRTPQQSSLVLSAVTAGLALAGLAIWAFFSFFVFGRLWKVFDQIVSPEKLWEFLEGGYLFIGVGISLTAAIGVFYFIISGDFTRASVLFGLAGLLYLVELVRFGARTDEITQRYL
jgi:hypothetical protein